jgi:hypothetical protein
MPQMKPRLPVEFITHYPLKNRPGKDGPGVEQQMA